MNQTSEQVAFVDHEAGNLVFGTFGYVRPHADKPRIYVTSPPPGADTETFDKDYQQMVVQDASSALQTPRLETHGFVFSREPSAVADFADMTQVKETYYDEAVRVALKHTGGIQAHVFDHLVRERKAGAEDLGFELRRPSEPVQALGRVHNDYTEASGARRLNLVQESLQRPQKVRRYCIVNIWRSIGGVIEDTPLGLCDARTVGAADLHSADIHYSNRQGEIYLVQHSERHQWWFNSGMDRDDVVVFKQYDSCANCTARFVPHAAFNLPKAAQATRKRRSIEVRVFVVMQ